MVKVMAFGTFDILHPGHEFFLRQAKNLGDFLTVVIGRDSTVALVKGKPPRHNELKRLSGVVGLNIANEVILGGLDDKYQVIVNVEPDIIALGYDQTYFIEELKKKFANKIKIIKVPAFKPELYKSSKLQSGF